MSFSVVPFSQGGNAIIWSGTGSAFNAEIASSQLIPVSPGTIYTFGAYVDATWVTAGAPTVGVYSPPGTALQTVAQTAGSKGVVSYTWTCPTGITEIALGFSPAACTVASGEELIFAQPIEVPGSTIPTYSPGLNWSAGGSAFAGQTVAAVMASRDLGVTWQVLRYGNGVPIPGSQLVAIPDYESSPGKQSLYYGLTQCPNLGVESSPSAQVNATTSATSWWAINPLDPSAAISLTVTGHTSAQIEQSSAHTSIGIGLPQVIASAIGGSDGSIEVTTTTQTQYQALQEMLASQQIQWLISPLGDGLYIRIGPQPGGMSSGMGNQTRQSTVSGTAASPVVVTTVTYNQVAAP